MEKTYDKVVKSNELINKSRYDLSVNEQKAIAYLITLIDKNDKEYVYDFSISEFAELLNLTLSGKTYAEIKELLLNLSKKKFWIKNEAGDDTISSWLSKATIGKVGIISVELDRDLVPHLINLKARFTEYYLFNILLMRSQYSVRLFEVLKSFQYRKSLKMELNALKTILNATAYENFAHFNRRVLQVALNEINKFTDIFCDVKLKKTGKKVTEIHFFIREKTSAENYQVFKMIKQKYRKK